MHGRVLQTDDLTSATEFIACQEMKRIFISNDNVGVDNSYLFSQCRLHELLLPWYPHDWVTEMLFEIWCIKNALAQCLVMILTFFLDLFLFPLTTLFAYIYVINFPTRWQTQKPVGTAESLDPIDSYFLREHWFLVISIFFLKILFLLHQFSDLTTDAEANRVWNSRITENRILSVNSNSAKNSIMLSGEIVVYTSVRRIIVVEMLSGHDGLLNWSCALDSGLLTIFVWTKWLLEKKKFSSFPLIN